jgi:protein-S-isoprenylcysteine O-methyltransferase Ste14
MSSAFTITQHSLIDSSRETSNPAKSISGKFPMQVFCVVVVVIGCVSVVFPVLGIESRALLGVQFKLSYAPVLFFLLILFFNVLAYYSCTRGTL